MDYSKVLLLGLAGSGHCVGMCGAFALAVSVGARNRRELLLRHVSYQLGKSVSYAFVGVLLLLASQWIGEQTEIISFQKYIGLLAGAAMILTGLLMAVEWRLPQGLQRFWMGSATCGSLKGLWQSPSLFKSVLVGWVNGFLPCGLSLMALLLLVSTGSVVGTVSGSFVFGFATLPALFLVGWLGRTLAVNPRRWLVRLSGVVLVALGVLTLIRDRPEVHGWMHKHLMPSESSPAGTDHHRHH